MRGKPAKWILAAALLAMVALFFLFDLHHYLSWEFLLSQQSQFAQAYAERPLQIMISFFLLYIGVTGLSLPGATILTLAGGFLFGLVPGTLLVSFASTMGATLAFLSSRWLFREAVQQKFGERLAVFHRGIEQDGNLYLLFLRLTPVVPFFVVNLVMGLTPIRLGQFFVFSQIGMLPATILYVNAGTELSQIESIYDVASPSLLISLSILGIFPLMAKKLVQLAKNKKKIHGHL